MNSKGHDKTADIYIYIYIRQLQKKKKKKRKEKHEKKVNSLNVDETKNTNILLPTKYGHAIQ